MEIHAPEKPIHSFRDFLIHLLTVTIGILIALSLEGLLEWRHHRELVHEARSNIVNKIRDNQRELTGSLVALDKNVTEQKNALKFVRDMLATGKSDVHELHLNSNLSQLNDASWKTAQAVGALSLMPYSEVKKYATVYQLQSDYLRLHSQTLDTVVNEGVILADSAIPIYCPAPTWKRARRLSAPAWLRPGCRLRLARQSSQATINC